MKNAIYVSISHLRGFDPKNKNEKQMLRIIQNCESSEFLSYFPEWNDLYTQIKQKFDRMKKRIENGFSKMKKICEQENEFDRDKFASLASKTNFRELLFILLDECPPQTPSNQISIYLSEQNLDYVYKLLMSFNMEKK